ncbi:D-ribose pyranase [Evansella caseinilytica]|uniref:D-ribose pyranase n=1 Tax=Evansella caseinilytica TaxID=1503961 RepID=A0A1H3UI38_9BACI|nr:D-ribose pyranase [Evansella caseinilytica]SDZ61475.1 D-ribose pyranase [Evansella caseinilytica]
MKKHGIVNRDIAGILAKLGHTDTIVIADCGLPIPDGVQCIDLSIKYGVPAFEEVFAEILNDMEVEKMICAEEIKQQNEKVYNRLMKSGFPIEYIDHEHFKKRTKQAKAIIRTGEVTPYANIILQAGVIF